MGDNDLELFIRVDLGADSVVRAIAWWRSQNARASSPFAAAGPFHKNPVYDQADRLDAHRRAGSRRGTCRPA